MARNGAQRVVSDRALYGRDERLFHLTLLVTSALVGAAVSTLLHGAPAPAHAGVAVPVQLTPPVRHRDLGWAGRALAAEVASGRLSAPVVRAAMLEREAMRWRVSPPLLTAVFEAHVAAAKRTDEYTGARSDPTRLGALKRGLLTRRALVYNKEASSLGALLLTGRMQCSSGSVAVVLAWLSEAAPPASGRIVFVHTAGHVQPGLLVGDLLHVVEATATDSTVVSMSLAKVAHMRVADGLASIALLVLGPEAPAWLRERALVHDAATPEDLTARTREPIAAGDDRLQAGFGVADVPPGDRPLASRTASLRDMRRPAVTIRVVAAQPRTEKHQRLRATFAALFDVDGAADVFGPTLRTAARPGCVPPPALRETLAAHGLRGAGYLARIDRSCAVVVEPGGCTAALDVCPAHLFSRVRGEWRVQGQDTLGALQPDTACRRTVAAPWRLCELHL